MKKKSTKKPKCKIVGEDGNVFLIIGKVRRALRDAGQVKESHEWAEKAVKCKSYDAVLQLIFKYVDPS